MMTRIHEKLAFECDFCGDPLETGKREFEDAIKALRKAGWTSSKIEGAWHHYCDECTKSMAGDG